jgi:hypothetical protein
LSASSCGPQRERQGREADPGENRRLLLHDITTSQLEVHLRARRSRTAGRGGSCRAIERRSERLRDRQDAAGVQQIENVELPLQIVGANLELSPQFSALTVIVKFPGSSIRSRCTSSQSCAPPQTDRRRSLRIDRALIGACGECGVNCDPVPSWAV